MKSGSRARYPWGDVEGAGARAEDRLHQAAIGLALPEAGWGAFARCWAEVYGARLRGVWLAVLGRRNVVFGDAPDGLARALSRPAIEPEEEARATEEGRVFLRQVDPACWALAMRAQDEMELAMLGEGLRPERAPSELEGELADALYLALRLRREAVEAHAEEARALERASARGVAVFFAESPRSFEPWNEAAVALAPMLAARDGRLVSWAVDALEGLGEVIVPRGAVTREPWSLRATRVQRGERIGWRLEVRGAERPLPRPERLRAELGLSEAEARVAVQLATGVTVVEAARQLGVSEATLRTHVRRLYAKSGTRRLPELVLFLNDPRWLDPI